jgi:hypothetical protein
MPYRIMRGPAVGLSELDHRVVDYGLQLGHNRGQQPVDAHGVAGGVRGGRGGGRGVGTPLVDEVDLQSVEVIVGDEPAANCSEVGSGFGQADVPSRATRPSSGRSRCVSWRAAADSLPTNGNEIHNSSAMPSL